MDNIILIGLISIIFFWLLVLTFLYIRSVRHYKKLKLGNSKTLYDSFEEVFRYLDKVEKSQEEFENRLTDIESFVPFPLQNFALLRFNPYGDVGGDQSFCMAMLDDNGDGVVLSSLHGRSTTRVYAKPVKDWKPDRYEMSEEELNVINLAKNKK